MLALEFPRDLVFTGALFGVAAFVWAGWAQEGPPRAVIWRVVLAIISLAGIALAAFCIPVLVRNWGAASAFDAKSTAFIVYIVIFWIEVAAIVGFAIWASLTGRSDLIAPIVLAIVGIHFLPLAWVFAQPIMAVAGVLLVIVAAVAMFVPAEDIARSFWCGVLGGPVFLVIGAICGFAGISALRT